jgi:Na+/proline symporter
MNKKTILTIISIVALLVGVGFGAFTDVLNDLPAIALTAFGLGGLVISTWNKSEKKGVPLLVSMIAMVICGVAAAFAEMSQDNLSKLISAVVAVVALIVAVLVPVISKAMKKD